MRLARRSSGQGKIGCIFWILLLGVAILIAVKMIPVKIRTAELHDFMVEQAKWSAGRSAEQVERSILARARELDLPLEEKNVRVEKRGQNERIIMEAEYVVPVEFPGYTYEWEFLHQVDRNIYHF